MTRETSWFLTGSQVLWGSIDILFELSVSRFWGGVCYNKLMSRRLVPVLGLVAAMILLVLMNFTTPISVGPWGALLFFTTFYVLMFCVAVGLVKMWVKMAGKQMRKKEYLYGAVIAFGPVMLILVGTMNVMTVALMAVFVFLTCFLVSKHTA